MESDDSSEREASPASSAEPEPTSVMKPARLSATCQIPDCDADLSSQSNFNQRHRICDSHRQVLSVQLNGISQRFCQRCATMQPVEDFEGDRRSCRLRPDVGTAAPAASKERKTRTGGGSISCQVPGCTEDLMKYKFYNQRYKICPTHRACFTVDVAGTAKRFCQQCAKLQDLDAFDGSKRSCRVKLQRHNQRRVMMKQSQTAAQETPEVLCKVPGCNADPLALPGSDTDLGVCAKHLDAEEIEVDGRVVRFCRKCSDLHPLGHFNENRHSCSPLLPTEVRSQEDPEAPGHGPSPNAPVRSRQHEEALAALQYFQPGWRGPIPDYATLYSSLGSNMRRRTSHDSIQSSFRNRRSEDSASSAALSAFLSRRCTAERLLRQAAPVQRDHMADGVSADTLRRMMRSAGGDAPQLAVFTGRRDSETSEFSRASGHRGSSQHLAAPLMQERLGSAAGDVPGFAEREHPSWSNHHGGEARLQQGLDREYMQLERQRFPPPESLDGKRFPNI